MGDFVSILQRKSFSLLFLFYRKYTADQHQKQAKLLAHILNEEKQMKKRKKLYPYLFDDPKREKTLIVKSHKRKSPTILREMDTSSPMDLEDGEEGDEEDMEEKKPEVIVSCICSIFSLL